MNKTLFLIINLILLSTLNLAHALDFGSVSDTVTGLLSAVSQLLDVIAWVAGAGFLISSIIKYREHRARPQSVPLSGPLLEFIIALILIFFPLIMQLTAKNQPGVTIGKVESTLNIGLINDSYHTINQTDLSCDIV